MIKTFCYLSHFIFFFILNVDAIGAQLQKNYNNQILSSIYADFNNDYITWNALPKFTDNNENESSILNKIITDDFQHLDNFESKENFTLDLLKYITEIKKKNCPKFNSNNDNYIFEKSLKNSLNFWSSYCQKKTNFNLLNSIDERFENISIINNLYFQFINDDFIKIKKIHDILMNNKNLLSKFNAKELNLLKIIFHSKKLEFSSENLAGIENSLNNLKIQLDKSFIIENYKDLLFLQLYQTSIYYFYAKEYKSSLALLSYLIDNNSKNKNFFIYKKISFMAELNPNNEIIELINSMDFENDVFKFFKNYLFFKTAILSNYDIDDLKIYFHNISIDNEWQKLELAMILAMEMYSQNKNHKALKFIENCCLKNLEKSIDPIHLFRYGILLERNDFIKKSENIIQKSIDISDGSYPFILNYLAYLWVDNDRNLDLAEKMLLKAVEESDFQDGAILDSLGWLYFKKNKMNLAEKWIAQAYEMEPSEPEIIDHLSQIYSIQGRNKEAMFLDNKILFFHKDYFKINEVLKRNYQ